MTDVNRPVVSVICKAYNHEKYIRKALEGFVMQKTDFPFEVLVHDDASTDHTRDIIEEFAQKYPDIIVPVYQVENQYSKGVKFTWSVLFPRSRGKYIAFCEGDDYWCDPQKLQLQVEQLEAHPDCSACTCVVQCINEDGSTRKGFFISKTIDGEQEGIVSQTHVGNAIGKSHLPFHICSYLLPRHVLQDLADGTAEFRNYMAGDAAIFRITMAKGSYYHIPRAMACHRLDSTNGYSYRFDRCPSYEMAKIEKTFIWGEHLFDEYSGHRFHEFVQQWVLYRLNICFFEELTSQKTVMDLFGLTPKMAFRSVRTVGISNCSIRL
jgi:glycosyltransferase involved in cell wall biosynthesis